MQKGVLLPSVHEPMVGMGDEDAAVLPVVLARQVSFVLSRRVLERGAGTGCGAAAGPGFIRWVASAWVFPDSANPWSAAGIILSAIHHQSASNRRDHLPLPAPVVRTDVVRGWVNRTSRVEFLFLHPYTSPRCHPFEKNLKKSRISIMLRTINRRLVIGREHHPLAGGLCLHPPLTKIRSLTHVHNGNANSLANRSGLQPRNIRFLCCRKPNRTPGGCSASWANSSMGSRCSANCRRR